MAAPIGSYERDLHRVFAERRTPSQEWVHVPNRDISEALDEYCADTQFHEVRDPLVLVGASGCGKSTALANWLEQRRHAQARRMRLSSLNPKEEFLFWHAAGCSRQSTFVGHMLRRLMMELKDHFEIAREVIPTTNQPTSFNPPTKSCCSCFARVEHLPALLLPYLF